jgi:hypothetical protein
MIQSEDKGRKKVERNNKIRKKGRKEMKVKQIKERNKYRIFLVTITAYALELLLLLLLLYN